MGVMMILATVITMAQAEPTFDQRWAPLTPLQHAQEPVKQKTEVAVKEEERVVHHAKRRHRASSCRYGHKVYHGKSWRCRR